MEWFILIVLVPLVLVPLVLLFGFHGCGKLLGVSEQPSDPPATPPPAPPALQAPTLTAKAVAYDQIELSWIDPNVGNTVRIQRAESSNPLRSEIAADVTGTAYTDGKPPSSTLKEQTLYRYWVRSFTPGTNTGSPDSNAAEATTWRRGWKASFDKPLTQDGPNYGSYTLVQRINKANLAASGSEIRLTLRRSFAGSIIFDKIYVSQPAMAGDAWNSHADLTQVAAGISLAAGGSPVVTLPPVAYALDNTKDLIVAMDIAPAGGNSASRPLPGAVCYVKSGGGEAALQVRPGPYDSSANADKVVLVDRIEVAVSEPPTAPHWKSAYDSPLTQNDANYGSYCLVQRLPKANLATGGAQVRITLRRPFGKSITLNKIYISQPAAAGNPWNSAADLTLVATGVSLPAMNGPVPGDPVVTLPPVAYTLNPLTDLLIAIDVDPNGGDVASRSVPGAVCYTKGTATGEANLQTRPGPYDQLTNKDKVVLIERIEVA